MNKSTWPWLVTVLVAIWLVGGGVARSNCQSVNDILDNRAPFWAVGMLWPLNVFKPSKANIIDSMLQCPVSK